MGCVSASLDTWLGDDPDRVDAVDALSAEALREAQGDDISPVGDAFVDLLAGRIEWDASISPVL